MSKQQQQIKPNNLPPKKTYYNIDDALRDSAQPRANEYDSINSEVDLKYLTESSINFSRELMWSSARMRSSSSFCFL